MASAPIANGSSSASESLTPAQKLMAQHDEGHQPTIEDVPDEEDLAHPPPSASNASPEPSSTPVLSEKAAGKQKAQEPGPESSKPKNAPKLDTTSEEAFPSLAKPRASANVPTAWGKKPSSVNNANGLANGSSNASSRASTPAPGFFTPSAASSVSLPGVHTDRITLEHSQMMPPKELKKSRNDILRDIQKSSRGVSIRSRETAGNKVTFEGAGPSREAVHKALREVASQLGSKQTIKIPIPASLRGHIVGRQGATIQAIQKKTGARVNLVKDKKEGAEQHVDEDDDSATVDVEIQGDAISASLARAEVERIIDERTSTVNMRLKHIPPEFYPFLAGPRNSGINALEGKGDVRLQIPEYISFEDAPPQIAAAGQPLSFAPQNNYPIQISGDRQAAQQAREALEQQYAQLQRQLGIRQEAGVQRGRHQFIVGERGMSPQDFLAETGCSLILPPPGHDDESIYIVGPPDKLEEASNRVLDLASEMNQSSATFPRQWPDAHARNLARYFQQRNALEQLQQAHNASIDADGRNWEIYSREARDGMKARSDIMNLFNSHPPSRLASMGSQQVNPFYHQHLRERHAHDIRNDTGVHLVIADDGEGEPELILVYEAPGSPSGYEMPRGQPSQQEVKQFQQALQQAQQQILSLIGQQEIASRDVEAPRQFHDKIRRYADREQDSLPEGQYPVELLFAAPAQRPNGFSVRGPTSQVDELEAKLREFILQQEQDEKERSYKTSFEFPQNYANFLIGRQGENIKKLRDEHDVEIQVNDGKVDLQGPERKCAAAKSHILSDLRKWEDEVTHTLKIEPQFHRQIIGPQGRDVNRLQDNYKCQINFPRSRVPVNDDADDSTEASHPRKGGRNQAADEVIIRGAKRDADKARDELLELLQFYKDKSHTATVDVQQSQVPSLIGSGGREIENLRLETGAEIDLPNANSPADPSGRVQIKLRGSKESVNAAKKLLQERAKVYDQTVKRSIDIDKKYHKSLIGSGGSNIRNIIVAAGGPDDRRDIARMVRFPRPEQTENTIHVEGTEDIVNKIIQSLQGFVSERENQNTEIVEVAPEKHRLLIGRGGDIRKQMEAQFKCSIDVPKQGMTGPARSQVKVTGQPADIQKAREHILNITKEQEGETIMVPRNLHHTIANNGQFFRNLRNNHSVTVDHGDHRPPPKPAAQSGARSRATGGALPLITDEAPTDSHSWEIIDNNTSTETGEIPWILRGSPENIAKARSQLEQALEKASKPSATGYLILPDPRAYRHIIGPQGSNINGIRKQTNTQVTVPRDQKQGEAIEIVGPKDGVEEAKDIILELVQNGGQGRH